MKIVALTMTTSTLAAATREGMTSAVADPVGNPTMTSTTISATSVTSAASSTTRSGTRRNYDAGLSTIATLVPQGSMTQCPIPTRSRRLVIASIRSCTAVTSTTAATVPLAMRTTYSNVTMTHAPGPCQCSTV